MSWPASTPFFSASRTTLALSFSICAMRSGSRSAAHSSSGRLLANSGASSRTKTSRTKWMCVNISAMDGLPSIALASSPPSGRARSRLSRMVLFRSQESSKVSSRLWSCATDVMTSSAHRFMALENPLQLEAMAHGVDHRVLEQVLDTDEFTPASPVGRRLELLIGDLGQVPTIGRQHVVCELRRALDDLVRILAAVHVAHRSAHPFADPGQIAPCRHEHVPRQPLAVFVTFITMG